MIFKEVQLDSRIAGRGSIRHLQENSGWRLSIPPGPAHNYRLAQLDDYMMLPRTSFCWYPPLKLSLDARISADPLIGTWGFGFWNDPFSANLGLGGTARRLPALPNTAWFFYGSPPNYLTMTDELPAQGLMAMTFQSQPIPPGMIITSLPLMPMIKWSYVGRIFRKLGNKYIRQASTSITVNPTDWHHFYLNWNVDDVRFEVDSQPVLETLLSPAGRGGLVLWIDNQYGAFPPDGKIAFGTLATPDAQWLEIKNLQLEN
jgi:hypothetical protein